MIHRLLRRIFGHEHRHDIRELNRKGQSGLWLACSCGHAVPANLSRKKPKARQSWKVIRGGVHTAKVINVATLRKRS